MYTARNDVYISVEPAPTIWGNAMFVSCLKILNNYQSLRSIPSFMPKFTKLVFMKSCVGRLLVVKQIRLYLDVFMWRHRLLTTHDFPFLKVHSGRYSPIGD